ncbi:MAG: transcriptional activator NhaR [Myxococcales bacterium]|jgi:LysR family transcriptional activator of nhaA|nr:transcriptional activator NhaR [Myxococcales bacterium]
MQWLNYHHLFYFWTVAREGSIAAASKSLRLAQPTISTQIRALEEALGAPLFVRAHRRLTLTDSGRVVFRYADEIFGLGRELLEAVRQRPVGRAVAVNVGLTFVVPKLVAYRLLEPALDATPPVTVHIFEDRLSQLLPRLANHELDVVLSDAPIATESNVRAFNHPLGTSGTTFFAVATLANKLRRGFPASLDGAPMLWPMPGSLLRRDLERWLSRQGVAPHVVAEFDDSALVKAFGQAGRGVFVGPTAIEAEIRRQYDVAVIGRTDEVVERFYAITVQRRIAHPAVSAICTTARDELFSKA